MKYLFLFSIIIFVFKTIEAQIQQIALVKPEGSTTIHTTFQDAYNAAADNDYIYLPGGTHNLGSSFGKKLFIYGAGFHPDSNQVTKVTIIPHLILNTGSSGSFLSGLDCGVAIGATIENVTIENCYLGISFSSALMNSILRNNILKVNGSCLYGGAYSIQLQGTNNIIANNLILGRVTSGGGNLYKNNIFSYFDGNCPQIFSCQNETFNNNIFRNAGGFTNSILNNNFGWWTNGIDQYNNQGSNNYPGNDFNSVFLNFNGTWSFSSNIHLTINSPYITAGNDGTQLGIYGGQFPTFEGWIPSNPHIYFKNVAEETNASGQLQIHFKARTN